MENPLPLKNHCEIFVKEEEEVLIYTKVIMLIQLMFVISVNSVNVHERHVNIFILYNIILIMNKTCEICGSIGKYKCPTCLIF